MKIKNYGFKKVSNNLYLTGGPDSPILLDLISDLISKTCYEKCIYVDLDPSTYFIDMDPILLVSKIKNTIRRLRKNHIATCEIRCNMDSISEQVIISQLNNDEKCTDYMAHTIISDGDGNGVIFVTKIDLTASEDESVKFVRDSVIIFSKYGNIKNDIIDTLINAFVTKEQAKKVFPLKILAVGLTAMIDYKDREHVIPEYTKTEISIYEELFSMNKKTELVQLVKIFAIKSGGKNLIPNPDLYDVIKPGQNTNMWPIVRFSEKEWKFVHNWIEKNHAFENELNLHEILDNPRYGNRLKLPVKNDKFDEKIVNIAYQFLNDKLYLFMIEEMNEHCNIYTEYRFDNPEHFENYVVNLESVTVGCYADSPKYYVNGEKAFLSTSVVYNAEPKELLQIMDSIMEIFIIIHNRPERTRIIKCSTTNESRSTNESKSKERKEKSVTNSNNSNTDTEERVLWRVLAPAKEAKDYIKEATGKHFNRADAIYTLEEWDRCGFYRTLKSGKVIWIEPTHCKRHLPISENVSEIQLKL